MPDPYSDRHREPPLGGGAIQNGMDRLVALDGRVASLLAMTTWGHDSRIQDSGRLAPALIATQSQLQDAGGCSMQVRVNRKEVTAMRDALSMTQPMMQPGAALPLVRWDGRAPTALIAQVEARLAAGGLFVVLAAAPPLGRGQDHALLERWWRTAHARVAGLCVGWAVLVPGADVTPRLLVQGQAAPGFADFPIRACADQAEALWWLRARLAKAGVAATAALCPMTPRALNQGRSA